MIKSEENWEPNVEETNDKRVVDVVWKLLQKYSNDKKSITQILAEIQETYGWLPQEMILEVSKQLEVPYGQVYQIAIFLRGENRSEALKSSVN
ncbi:MAG: NAD(P)H-dependent oxidoreductase subunit E [Candidatus Bathyarchaeia archaeon]|jgi:NADH:ubiquinone oxidoreductase subunit E